MCCIYSPISFLGAAGLLRSSLVTAGRRIYFDSDVGEGTSLPANWYGEVGGGHK
jgi:hypothetical protein